MISPEAFSKLTRVSKSIVARKAEMEHLFSSLPGGKSLQAAALCRPTMEALALAIDKAQPYLKSQG